MEFSSIVWEGLSVHHAVIINVMGSAVGSVLEIAISHWPFSNQFQHLANQINLFSMEQ